MQDYIKIIEDDMPEQIRFLQDLIRINSEGGDAVTAPDGSIYPFGQGVQDALEMVLKACEEMGFKTRNADNYGAHAEFGDEGKIMGILGHLDVVPAGDGWSFAPYSGDVADGYIYGRGTTDDKGPVVAALFAMRALKKAGYEPGARIRLILGLDEETNWIGMDKYLEKIGPADYGFTPDGDFPVVHAEKGILTFNLVRKFTERTTKGLQLRSLEGGAAANMVAEKARAVINSQDTAVYDAIKDRVSEYREAHKEINGIPAKINCKGVGKSLEISVEGKSAHGASPSKGLSAISILMDFLGGLNFADEQINDIIGFYNDHIGFDLGGERMGCEMSDDVSGALTFNVGVLNFDRKALSLTINVRYPVKCTEEAVYKGITETIEKYDIGLVKKSAQEPIFFDMDTPMIKTFMDVYQEFTGDMDTPPMAISGGTYARSMKNHVAFGALFPGDPDVMHQRDERLALDRFETMTKIYAKAIYRLSQKDFSV